MEEEKPTPRLLYIVLPPLFFLVTFGANLFIYQGGHADEYLGTRYDFSRFLHDYQEERGRYHFLLNFVSDLGRLETYGGESNISSAVMFCISLTGTGVLFLVMIYRVPRMSMPSDGKRNLAALLGLCKIGAAAFIVIGWVPEDIHNAAMILHLIFVNIAFGSTMVVCVFVVLMQMLVEKKPRIITGFYALLFAGLTGYLVLILYWYITRDITAYFCLVVGQKIIVFFMVAHMLALGIMYRRLRRRMTA